MSWDRFMRWVLFSAGIITSIVAGCLFYIGREALGAAFLAVTVGFLCFATRFRRSLFSKSNNKGNTDEDLHEMSMLIADIAVSSLKNIGRTVPPSMKEIENLENRLNNFLSYMPVTDDDRDAISEEFDKLKNRTRRSEGGRAIARSSRL